MKIILLEDVVNLGHIGDVVEVKAGYARNYLIPKSMAILATAVNIAYIEKSKAEYVAKQNTILEEAKARLATIQGQVFTITAYEEKLLSFSACVTAIYLWATKFEGYTKEELRNFCL